MRKNSAELLKVLRMKLLKDFELKNKRILLRVDFNVGIDEQGRVVDDFKIVKTLPTIKYLVKEGAKIILMSHLGEPDKVAGEARQTLSLKYVAQKTSELLGQKIELLPDCVGETVQAAAEKLSPGKIVMLENLRFHKEEKANNEWFAKQLAGLGEIYINDAFGVDHRAHASLVAITKFLPSGAGLLLEAEIKNLTRARQAQESPLCVIIGGAKISTKIKLIESFFNKAQDIILGGALANTVLYAQGIAVGRSMIEEEVGDYIKKLSICSAKIHLPVDTVLCSDKEGTGLCRVGPVGKVGQEELILDIGPDSEKLFNKIISEAKTIIWNGPLGFFETEAFQHGSLAVAEAIVGSGAFSVVGGGETVAFIRKIGLLDKFSFVSTGGGAMLEFLAGEPMPGIEALKE